jgi:amidase
MSEDEVCYTPATKLARQLRNREISARELLTSFLRRIDEINPVVNAIVTLDPDRAYQTAMEADSAAAKGAFLGPLHGLPIAIKDTTDTKGMRTTYGLPIYGGHVPDSDAPVVDRLRRSGVVVIGKTNTPEFAVGSQTFNRVFGATRNPYALARTCGGSSGGAAVAVAAGMLPFADGTDLAASVRNPASFCNVVGVRPTPGRTPRQDSVDVFDPLSVIGAIARSVGDAALLLSGMSAAAVAEPLTLPGSAELFMEPLEANLSGVRIAWSPTLGGLPVEDEVLAVVDRARPFFESFGCKVVEAEPDLSTADEVFQVLRALHLATTLGELLARNDHDSFKETLVWNVEKGLGLTGSQVAAALRGRSSVFRIMHEFLTDYDALALPTVQVPPFPIEWEWVHEIAGIPQATYIDWMRTCSRITVTAHPAISVPAGFTSDGLPVGLQLVGRYGDDFGLLRLAHAFEQATGFGTVQPKLPARENSEGAKIR